VTPSSDV